MENPKDKKWVKIIALYFLVGAVLSIVLYPLSYLSAFEDIFTPKDRIRFIFDFIILLAIFAGLWKFAPWGWKAAVIFIPLYSVYDIVDTVFIDYERGLGVFFSLALLVNAFMLSFLFRFNIKKLFLLPAELWEKFRWSVEALYLMAAFLFVYDLVNDTIAVVLAISLFFGFRVAARYRKSVSNRIRTI